MAYLVLAYPELVDSDLNDIQRYRELHDELYFKVVDPHFTLVFPVFDIAEETFIKEVKNITKGQVKFNFYLRCATISKDAFNDSYHTFLVPDEGYSHFVRLHDRLYSGAFMDNLRLDINYIPHVAIGNSNDKSLCKKMVDEWNEKDFAIRGSISALTIIRYEAGIVTNLVEIELA